MTDVRRVLGFDVGDIVICRDRWRHKFQWEVLRYDLPRRRLAIRRWTPDGKSIEEEVPPRKLALVQTAEERVAEALMRGAE